MKIVLKKGEEITLYGKYVVKFDGEKANLYDNICNYEYTTTMFVYHRCSKIAKLVFRGNKLHIVLQPDTKWEVNNASTTK